MYSAFIDCEGINLGNILVLRITNNPSIRIEHESPYSYLIILQRRFIQSGQTLWILTEQSVDYCELKFLRGFEAARTAEIVRVVGTERVQCG